MIGEDPYMYSSKSPKDYPARIAIYLKGNNFTDCYSFNSYKVCQVINCPDDARAPGAALLERGHDGINRS